MSKWCNQGENQVANILFGSTAVDSTYYLGLYTAPTSEPAIGSTISNLTEPSGGGYARIALARGTWSVSGSAASYAQQTFSASGVWGNVYGYFLCQGAASGTAGLLMAVEQFSNGPYNIGSGDSINITPTVTVV